MFTSRKKCAKGKNLENYSADEINKPRNKPCELTDLAWSEKKKIISMLEELFRCKETIKRMENEMATLKQIRDNQQVTITEQATMFQKEKRRYSQQVNKLAMKVGQYQKKLHELELTNESELQQQISSIQQVEEGLKATSSKLNAVVEQCSDKMNKVLQERLPEPKSDKMTTTDKEDLPPLFQELEELEKILMSSVSLSEEGGSQAIEMKKNKSDHQGVPDKLNKDTLKHPLRKFKCTSTRADQMLKQFENLEVTTNEDNDENLLRSLFYNSPHRHFDEETMFLMNHFK